MYVFIINMEIILSWKNNIILAGNRIRIDIAGAHDVYPTIVMNIVGMLMNLTRSNKVNKIRTN